MTLYEQVSLFLGVVQSVALILVLVIYARQLAAMRHAAAGQSFLSLASFLQAEDVRQARTLVITTLADRGFKGWNSDEIRAAAKVCSSYGVAGIVLESKLVPAEPVIANWGPSIRHCHAILRDYISEMQKPENSGPEYWAVFDRLSAVAERAQKPLSKD